MLQQFRRDVRSEAPVADTRGGADDSTTHPSDVRPVSREEFAAVAVACLRQLRRTALRLAGNAADADDLVQETYRLAFQHSRELRQVERCSAWLRRIMERQAVSRLRRQLAAPRLVLLRRGDIDQIGRSASPDADPAAQVALREVYTAIQALPPDLRLALTLSELNGFRYDEIAAIAQCPLGTVRSRIARARARLMRTLAPHAEECGLLREGR